MFGIPSFDATNCDSVYGCFEKKTTECHSSNANFVLHAGSFRSAALAAFQNMLFLLRIAKWKVAYANGEKFDRHEQLPYFSRVPDESLAASLEAVIDEVFDGGGHEHFRALALDVVQRLVRGKSVSQIIQALDDSAQLNARGQQLFGDARYSTFISPSTSVLGTPSYTPARSIGDVAVDMQALNQGLEDGAAPKVTERDGAEWHPDPYFSFTVVRQPERLVISWPPGMGATFMKATSAVAQALRNERRDPTFVDFVAFHIGHHLLNMGQNPFDRSESRFLGTVGFRRDTQTYVSLTDPGDGHVFGTTRKSRWMRGAIVHVEHLERPQNLSRDHIESYRIPSILDFARVRLHTGSESPNTYFVGRPLHDSGEFGHDFIKVVNTTASAASAAFALGAAECKVAMDGLRTSQMVAYMRALAGHSLRSHRQYLSAAFNLNSPMLDDLLPNADGSPRVLSDQMDIGRRGIELAAQGGFDKCTWDGAADAYPSQCIILQLGFQNALELVHRAHSVGLVCYMSAGFKFHNIKDAVFSGVDGIGIGGAQILRYMDGVSGMHGPYTEEYIDRIDIARDNAAHSVRGRGAHLLTRLDQMHFEGSLSTAEAELRAPLYTALHDADEEAVQAFLSDEPSADTLMALPDDGERPWLGRARRLLRHAEPVLRRGALAMPDGREQWAEFALSLASLVDDDDEVGIHAYSLSEPWASFRRAYRKLVDDAPYHQGEAPIGLKVTPYTEAL